SAGNRTQGLTVPTPGANGHGRNVTANVTIPSIGTVSAQRITVEDVYPSVDGGRFAVKRIAGEPVEGWADMCRDGDAVLAAELLWRPEHAQRWQRSPMRLHGNDRWVGQFVPPSPGRYLYAIETWTDVFGTWRRDYLAKQKAGLDVSVDLAEGR